MNKIYLDKDMIRTIKQPSLPIASLKYLSHQNEYCIEGLSALYVEELEEIVILLKTLNPIK